jgi:hypothetical protein
MGSHLTILRRVSAAAFAIALLASAVPAHALEGSPQGKKAKERHVFRDVQLGLSHPSSHGKSTQTSKPPPQIFPWFFPPVVPSKGQSSSQTH